MVKVIGAVVAVLGFWAAVEIFVYGPSGAFDGKLAPYLDAGGTAGETAGAPTPRTTTAQRAGSAVGRAHEEAAARRERLLRE